MTMIIIKTKINNNNMQNIKNTAKTHIFLPPSPNRYTPPQIHSITDTHHHRYTPSQIHTSTDTLHHRYTPPQIHTTTPTEVPPHHVKTFLFVLSPTFVVFRCLELFNHTLLFLFLVQFFSSVEAVDE